MRRSIRPIRSDDKPTLSRFHERLSADTRYRRYHGAKGSLTRGDLRYLTEVDGRHHVALVATDERGEFDGVVRAVADASRPDEAELAIVIADDVQGSGVGRRLVSELIERCREEGVRRIVLEVQGDNHRALRFFQSLGARQQSLGQGICRLVIELDSPR